MGGDLGFLGLIALVYALHFELVLFVFAVMRFEAILLAELEAAQALEVGESLLKPRSCWVS
jgi:hypothetical protein